MVFAIIAIGLLTNLIAWRWRKFANVIIYQEALYSIAMTFVPYDYGDFDTLVILQNYIIVYIMTAVKTG